MYNMSISAAADVQRLVHRFVQNIGECLCSFFVFSKVHNGCIISCYNHCCACMVANNHTYLTSYCLFKASAGWCWLGHLGQASQLAEYLQLLSSSQLTSPNHGFHGEFNVMQTFSSDRTPQSRGDIDNIDAAHGSEKIFRWWEECFFALVADYK